MKKLLMVVATAVGASILKKNLDRQKAEKNLWSEATGAAKESPSAPVATSGSTGSSGDSWSSTTDKPEA